MHKWNQTEFLQSKRLKETLNVVKPQFPVEAVKQKSYLWLLSQWQHWRDRAVPNVLMFTDTLVTNSYLCRRYLDKAAIKF